jgi:alpha-L-fucosidase
VLSADVTKAMIEADPNLIILGPHIWVTGNEAGHVTYPLWNAVNTKDDTLFTRPRGTEKNPGAAEAFSMLETDVHTGHPLGKFWRPIEAVTDQPFGRGRWFWRADTTHATPGEQIVDSFYHPSVGLGANLMINFAPDQRGLVPDVQVKGAAGFAKALKERFSNLIAETKGVTTGDTVELSWDQPQEIHYVVLMENIANGQKIAAYTLEAWVDGQWQVLKSRNPAGYRKKSPAVYETIGHKKIDRLVPVTTNKVRFRCLNAVTQPVEIRSMAVYGK